MHAVSQRCQKLNAAQDHLPSIKRQLLRHLPLSRTCRHCTPIFKLNFFPEGVFEMPSRRAESRARSKSPAPKTPQKLQKRTAQSPSRSTAKKSVTRAATDMVDLLILGLGTAAAGAGGVSMSVKLPLTQQSKQHLEVLWLTCALVSIPHVYYLWLWRPPKVHLFRKGYICYSINNKIE